MNPLPTLTAVGGTVALAAAAAGCGNSTSAQEPPKATTTAPAAPTAQSNVVTGTVNEFAVKVAPDHVTAGKVTFKVTNTGKLPHEFVILKTGRPAAKLGSGARVSETGHVGEIGDMAAGATKSVTLNLKPGHYSVICNLPSHYKMGMHADLTVS
jgi:uncharacterized cupredoxin-like copper-binding protein